MRHSSCTIMLSASVPSKKRSAKYHLDYAKIPHAQLQIEEAVIGLARNIFQAKGRIIFGGHPSISPLVASVASEFNSDHELEKSTRFTEYEKPVIIYQSRAYEPVIPQQTINLLRSAYAEVNWTDARNGEIYDGSMDGNSQCKASLEFMRREMMKKPIDALVCMGGMEGVENEFDLFREIHSDKPIFLMMSTGGASKILADTYAEVDTIRLPDSIDYQTTDSGRLKGENEPIKIIPYAYITSQIVKEVLEIKSNHSR